MTLFEITEKARHAMNSELINLMHYDPESLPEDAAKDLAKIEKQIKAAMEIAKKISGNCER